MRYVTTVVIVIVAGTLVLGQLGISIAPILAAAGEAGIAVGFAAQSLIKDYFIGFFLLLKDQIRVGDVVEISGASGVVEGMTLRYIQVRNFEGHVFFVPNGSIVVVKNMTRDFAQAVIEVGVAYREFLKRLKKAFDERDIEIPFPHMTIYSGQSKDGTAPPLHKLVRAA